MAVEIETHAHDIVDTDPRFTIDPKTKKISAGTTNLVLAQRAKNSERLTFYVPDKVVEGHDLTLCNDVQIHFENIDEKTGRKSFGPYKVEDLKVEEDAATLSWLVDEDATRYAGALIFSIHFACIGEDGSIVYDFPTLTYTELTVGATIWNSQTIVEEYPDIIRDFEQRIGALEKAGTISPEQIQGAVNNYLDENPVTSGATAEQAAQIEANTAAIAELKENGSGATAEQLAQITANKEAIADIQDPIVSGTTAISGNTYTITMPRESGAVDTLVVEFDGNGYVSKLTENGRVIPWTTTGV